MKCCFKGLKPLFRDAITLLKFLCRTIAPERLIGARLNLKLKNKKINKMLLQGLGVYHTLKISMSNHSTRTTD